MTELTHSDYLKDGLSLRLGKNGLAGPILDI